MVSHFVSSVGGGMGVVLFLVVIIRPCRPQVPEGDGRGGEGRVLFPCCLLG